MEELLSKNNLDLQDLQTFHKRLDEEKHFNQDIFINVAYLSSEIGEFVSAIRKLDETNGEEERIEAQSHVGEELADCLAYIVKLANYVDVDLHEAYVSKMRRNLNREWHSKR